jgi:hypothetical protein
MLRWITAVSAVAGSGALGFGALVTRRLLRYRKLSPDANSGLNTPAIIPDVTLDRYRPMARLLRDEDLRFLQSRPGYRPEMGARLRRSHRRIFRMYLAELSADFRQLHAAARRIVADAPEQHSALVGMLMHQQLVFWRALVAIELRLALDGAGLGAADAQRLIQAVEQLQRAIVSIHPAQGALPA